MKESITYQRAVQEGVEKGRKEGLKVSREIAREIGFKEGLIEGGRRLLLLLGTKRFGPPSPAITSALNAVDTFEHLIVIASRIFDADSWESLMFGIDDTRRLLLRLGTKRFGPPSPTAMAAFETIDSLDRIEKLAECIFEADSWESLLFSDNGTPSSS